MEAPALATSKEPVADPTLPVVWHREVLRQWREDKQSGGESGKGAPARSRGRRGCVAMPQALRPLQRSLILAKLQFHRRQMRAFGKS